MGSDNIDIEEYNNIPVVYCTHCLSLNIKIIEGIADYCDVCGNTEIETASIEQWEELYKNRYGKKLINKEKYGRE